MEYSQAQEDRQVVRVPLVTALASRGYFPLKDGLLQNAFVETSANGKKYVRKRPGFASSFNTGVTGTGQGLSYYGDRLYAITNNTLLRLGAAQTSYASGSAWTSSGATNFGTLSSHSAVVFKGQIFVIGGITALGVYSNAIWSSQDGVNWTQVAPTAPWGTRYSLAVVVYNEQLFVLGGSDAGGVNVFNDVWSSPDGINWTQLTASAPWTARRAHRAIVFNNQILVMGGASGAAVYNNEVWASSDGITWSQLPAAGWSIRGNFGVYTLGNSLVVAGGNNAAAGLNDCYVTTDAKAWTLQNGACFATVRYAFGYATYDNKLWVIGGQDAVVNYYASIYYSTDLGVTWTLVTNTPGFTGRSFCAAVAFPTPISVSSIQAMSLWVIGGSVPAAVADIYYANINSTGGTSFALTTGAPSYEPMQFSLISPTSYLVFKNTYDLWVLWGNSVVRLTDQDYPKRTVPGIAYLNQRIYVMDPNGVIYGSDLQDPLSYSALNFIEAEYEPDSGVAIAKYLNFVVAFGSRTLQFFYDTGTYPGSPLAVQANMTKKLGCSNGYTLVSMDGTLVWVGGSEEAGRGVFYLEQGQPVKISTPEIDRILDQETFASVPFACGFGLVGHRFYMLKLTGVGYTLVYDFVEKEWFYWTSALGAFSGYGTDGRVSYFLSANGATVYDTNETYLGDTTESIFASGITDVVDFGTVLYKFQRNVTVVGDRSSLGGLVLISWTDDDYQNFQPSVSITLNQQKPWSWRGGRFVRRGYKWIHYDATTPFRAEALEVAVDFGNV